MRILLVTLLLGAAMGGCGGDDTTSVTGADLSTMAGMHDMAGVDLASAMCVDAGPKAFGAACTTDCDCASGMCRQFQMGAVQLCTQNCTLGCPAPPSTGACTNNGYCKF